MFSLQLAPAATAEDYVLLEKLNVAAAARYEEMSKKTVVLAELTASVHARRAQMAPYLAQVRVLFNTVKTDIYICQLNQFHGITLFIYLYIYVS